MCSSSFLITQLDKTLQICSGMCKVNLIATCFQYYKVGLQKWGM